MSRVSFEEACKIHKGIVTSDSFHSIGMVKTMAIYKEALDKVGWTQQELCEEAKNRMRARIAQLQAEELSNKKEK
jgi:hypothetical protein